MLIVHDEQDGLVCALQIPSGRFCDPPGSEGCSELCMGLIQKGTKGLSSEQLSDIFEHHGASLFAEAGEEHLMIGVKMLSRFRETLFPRFWEMVVAPRLDTAEFTRLQQEMITALKAETNDPGTIVNRHFYHELAGGTVHPAGRHHSVKSIKNLTLASVEAYHHDYINPAKSVFVCAGNVTREWFERFCLPLLEAWKPRGNGQLCDAPAVENRPSAVRFIEKNDLTQVSMVIGQAAPGELHGDRNRIALANYVLGAGNFSSRLMNRIRSSSGKTYSISSHITTERHFGALTIATSTQNRQAGEVLKAILEEYSRFCREGITAEELESVKRFAIGNMAFQLEGLTNLVEKMLWLSFYNRTVDYIETFDEMICSIDIDTVNEAIRRNFDPGRLIIAAVGRKKEVLADLSAFGTLKCFHYRDVI